MLDDTDSSVLQIGTCSLHRLTLPSQHFGVAFDGQVNKTLFLIGVNTFTAVGEICNIIQRTLIFSHVLKAEQNKLDGNELETYIGLAGSHKCWYSCQNPHRYSQRMKLK
jgi:hypothetical protein